MIITRTPFRISFSGGGSDLPSFYTKHEGCVLSASINKYMYILIHPTFNRDSTIIKYSKTETCDKIREIQHPIARQILLDHALSGVEIASIADVPSGTGLGSSSAYTVGVIHAVNAFKGKYVSQEKIAKKACEVEIEKLGEPIGKQDQYGVAVGGIKFIKFLKNGLVDVSPIVVSAKYLRMLEENLVIFYTGQTHNAGKILAKQNDNIKNKKNFEHLVEMTKLTYKLKKSMEEEDLSKFGEILNEGWQIKKQLVDEISNQAFDYYYDIGLKNGASGGKLLGAGGGGFLLFYCEEENQKRLKAALSDLVELPFEFDFAGTKVIYVGNKNWE